jgi:hypothetical protein
LTAHQADVIKLYNRVLFLLDNPPEIDDTVFTPALHDTETWLLENSGEKDVCEYFKVNTPFYNKRAPIEVSVWDFIYNESEGNDGAEKRMKYLP